MKGIGNDIIEVQRIARAIARHGERFLNEIFTPAEQAYCLQYQMSERHFAGRFAAKEAIVKALGTGISEKVHWKDIEILNDSTGKPSVFFSDRVQKQFQSLRVIMTISHCKEYAIATAIWV